MTTEPTDEELLAKMSEELQLLPDRRVSWSEWYYGLPMHEIVLFIIANIILAVLYRVWDWLLMLPFLIF